MTSPAFARLQRVLDLEEKQNWRNRGVIGGLQAMATRWADDARAEGIDARQVDALVSLMKRYGSVSADERPAVAADLRRILGGEWEPESAVSETAASFEAEPPLEIPVGTEDSAAPERAETRGVVVKAEESTQPAKDTRSGFGKVYEAVPDEDIYLPPEPTYLVRERQRREQAAGRHNPRDLQGSVTLLPGVGEATAEQLGRLGIVKVVDLLWHLPARYDDFSQTRTIDKLQPGEQVTVVANLWDVRERKIGLNRSMVQAIVGDSTGTLHATWWNKWIIAKLQPFVGQTLRFSGTIGLYMGQKTIENAAFEELDDARVATGRMSPIYPLTEGVSNNRLRNLIHDVLDGYARFLNDPLPAQLRQTYDLANLSVALEQIHFPDSQEQLATARRRLAI